MKPPLKDHQPPLILASGSAARRDMLTGAGLVFSVLPAAIDERALQTRFEGKLSPQDMAAMLACEKAKAVSAQIPEAFVIGADQILVYEGRIYTKPKNKEEALLNLKALSGHTHALISAVAVAKEGEVLWQDVDEVRLTMKDLPESALVAYIKDAGDSVLRTVGSYELEGLGSWLFDKIDGDYFTVLGMPLLPLLSFLRPCGFGPLCGDAGENHGR